MGQYWSPGMTLKMIRREFVAEALKFYNGREDSAAQALEISIPELKGIVAEIQFDKETQAKFEIERKQKSAEFLEKGGKLYLET